MKKQQIFRSVLAVLLAAVWLLCPLGTSASYTPPDTVSVTATSAMVVYLEATASGLSAVEQHKDTVLYEKNADRHISPAATVRVMVGLYAMKYIREHNIDIYTATGTYTEALERNHIWGTDLGLASMQIGETWTINDLLSLSMIQTAADAAVTLAYALCGSVDAFVLGMNLYAQELGCRNTSFSNVHGLDDARQYTTARDMYVMLRCALDYPELEQRMSLTEYTVHPVSGGEVRSWENTNYMLRGTSDYYYSPLVLGKTGISERDGAALASVAEDSGYRYMTIVLGCPESGGHYENSRSLYRWAFNDFTYKTVLSKNQPVDRLPVTLAWNVDNVTLVAKDTVSCILANGVDETGIRTVVTTDFDTLEAPIEKGTVLGKVELYIRMDEKIGEMDLVAGETVARSEALYLWKKMTDFLGSPWFTIAIGLVLLAIAGYMLLTILHHRDKHRKVASTHKYKTKK